MVELSNDLLTVSLHPKGAEIISIKGKKDQLNYMWRRDASQWQTVHLFYFQLLEH